MTISHYSRLLFHTVLKPRVNALQCTKLASNWIWKLPLFQLKLLNRSIEISEFTSNIPEYKLNRLTLVLAWVFHPQRVKIYWASQTTPQISWNMLTKVINMTTKQFGAKFIAVSGISCCLLAVILADATWQKAVVEEFAKFYLILHHSYPLLYKTHVEANLHNIIRTLDAQSKDC